MTSTGERRRLLQVEKEGIFSESSSPPRPPPTVASKQAISLDFERVVNEYSIQACKDRRQNGGHAGRTATRWALTILSGILTGICTVLIVSITEKLVDRRASRLDRMIIDPDISQNVVFLDFSLFSLLLSVCSSLLCVAWAPDAEGSGIPEVKAYLNGVRVKRFSSWNLFFVKIVGTILSVASSLAVGKEGPLVHIGAIVGASCSKLSIILSHLLTTPLISSFVPPSLWLWTTSNLAYFANDSEKRDLITIGSACGLAASFGTPVGGLLFVLDDISSHFDKAMSLRVLVANALGTFCLALYRKDLSEYGAISLSIGGESDSSTGSNIFVSRFEEVPFFLLVGVIGGLLGGTYSLILDIRKRRLKTRFSGKACWKLGEVAILSVVTSFLLFYATAMLWTCKDIDRHNNHLEAVTEGRRFFCAEGQVNEFATILLGSRDKAIRWILTDPSQFDVLTLFIVGTLFYFLTISTFGSSLPLGVFTPTVLIGASLGGASGLVLQTKVDSEITPSTFAILGVAALLAGVQRSTVSVCVILVEATGQIKVLIPVIIVVVVARYVASFVHKDGIYEISMALRGYPYLEHKEETLYDMFQVGDVMSQPVLTVRHREKASHLVRLLKNSNLNGFPVVDENDKFIGLVRRNQIVALMECGIFEENDDNLQGLETPSSISRHVRSISGNYHISEKPSSISENKRSKSWTPKPGVHKSPLMHWAYHIKDDRYNYLETENDISRDGVEDLVDDEYDSNQYLLSIHDIVESIRSVETSMGDDTSRKIPFAGDDSLPGLNSTPMQRLRKFGSRASASERPFSGDVMPLQQKPPTGFAKVGSGAGNVIIHWLNPDYNDRIVNLKAVMNRGALSIPHFFPLSKAHVLFTKLGLRWIVVTGSKGGDVVGILTRKTLLPSHIKKCTDSQFP